MRATLALIRYLADMRFKLSRWLHATESMETEQGLSEIRILFSPSLDTQDPRASRVPVLELEEAAELVDTTLFRAYMLCRPQLVGPLVRRPNRCIPSVVQNMLEQAHVRRRFRGSTLIHRNIEIWLNSFSAKGFIDKHCSCCNR